MGLVKMGRTVCEIIFAKFYSYRRGDLMKRKNLHMNLILLCLVITAGCIVLAACSLEGNQTDVTETMAASADEKLIDEMDTGVDSTPANEDVTDEMNIGIGSTPATEDVTDEMNIRIGSTPENDEVTRTDEIFDLDKYEDLLTIRYFNLEHGSHPGESIYIQTPDGTSMLIDAGSPHVDLQLVRNLQQLGIEKIDAAVSTHPHSDHIGGFPLVLKAFEVGKLYMPEVYNDRFYYHDLMDALEQEEVSYEYVEAGTVFELGEDVTVEILHPEEGVLPDAAAAIEEEWQINYFSLVLKVTYKDTSFLFTGDIFSKQELELVDKKGEQLQADFLHVPHHGNASSSSLPFIRSVAPQVAVLGSNIFEIGLVNRYEKEGVDVYLTDMHGHVLVTSDGKELDVITEKDWENPMSQKE